VFLLEEEILLAVPAGFPFPQKPDILDLEGLPLILPREGSALRTRIQQEILSRPLVAEVLAVTSDNEILRRMVLQGDGAAFWPEKTWPRPDPSRVRLLRLEGAVFRRELYALLPPEQRDNRETPLLEALVRFFGELNTGKRTLSPPVA